MRRVSDLKLLFSLLGLDFFRPLNRGSTDDLRLLQISSDVVDELLIRFTVCSLCILIILILVISHLGFEFLVFAYLLLCLEDRRSPSV